MIKRNYLIIIQLKLYFFSLIRSEMHFYTHQFLIYLKKYKIIDIIK